VPLGTDIAVIPSGITVTQNVSGGWTNPGSIRVSGKLVFTGNEPRFNNACTLEVWSGGEFVDNTIGNQLFLTPNSFLKVLDGGKWTATGEYETLIYNYSGSKEYQFPTAVMIGPFQISVYSNEVTYSTTVLPLKLISFTGKKSNVNNLLNWQTASEVNTDVFFIERSSDAIRYESLGKVAAKGSTGDNYYTFTDRTALKGNNFYRLKMTDLNGSFTYSETPININRDASPQISVYPSPAKDVITVVTGIAGKLAIYSSEGKLVHTQQLLAGNATVDVSRLVTGIYFIEQAGQRLSFTKVSQ